ncbi:MAG TPA: gamma carbonic anhydrase family protein [Rhodospirillaceae bacterium]|nr:gamma carbonic anhydrase family protein [Rhodospirillaceae bacterium]
MPTILPFRGVLPQIHESAFIAPSVVIIGDVVIGAETSIWPGCILRGDMGPIRIGAKTNIQDGTVVHITEGGNGTHIGDNVTVGHMALLHDCTVGNGAFIGMRATILDYGRVEAGGMLAAGALLTNNKVVGSGQIWAGSPAKYWREITATERAEFQSRPEEYAALAKEYK